MQTSAGEAHLNLKIDTRGVARHDQARQAQGLGLLGEEAEGVGGQSGRRLGVGELAADQLLAAGDLVAGQDGGLGQVVEAGGFRAGDWIELGQAASLWRASRSRAPMIGMWIYRPTQDRPTAASIALA